MQFHNALLTETRCKAVHTDQLLQMESGNVIHCSQSLQPIPSDSWQHNVLRKWEWMVQRILLLRTAAVHRYSPTFRALGTLKPAEPWQSLTQQHRTRHYRVTGKRQNNSLSKTCLAF